METQIIERKINKINVWIKKAIKWEYKNNSLILSFLTAKLEILEEDLQEII